MPKEVNLVGRGRQSAEFLIAAIIVCVLLLEAREASSMYPNIFSKVPYWLNAHCNKSAITRHLLRVCVVYKRNAAPFFLTPPATDGGDEAYDLEPPPFYGGPLDPTPLYPMYPVPFPPIAPPPPYFYPFPRRPFFPDPFKRWRRQARINEIVVKCCVSGCSSADFVEVDREYNLCDK